MLQFERTKEGLQLYPIYFGEDFILCTPEGGLPLNDLFPEKLRNEDQQRIIQSHSEQENPVLVKYVFKMKVNENTIYIFLLGILAGIICMQCVNHFRKSPKDVYVDNFEYEKESLGILKREELKMNTMNALIK